MSLGDGRFGSGEGECVVGIVNIEDPGWLPTQYNIGGSTAYGLPQALPGGKMKSAGADWATNGVTQLRWLVYDYVGPQVGAAYSTPCVALAHDRAYGWY